MKLKYTTFDGHITEVDKARKEFACILNSRNPDVDDRWALIPFRSIHPQQVKFVDAPGRLFTWRIHNRTGVHRFHFCDRKWYFSPAQLADIKLRARKLAQLFKQ